MVTTIKKQKTKNSRERIINDAPKTFTDAIWPVGSVAHQGDLILIRIPKLPKSKKVREQRQLADGHTQGSRHVLSVGDVYNAESEEVISIIKKVCPKADIGEQYIGPVFKTIEGLAELVHPEHGNHCYEGDMVVAVVYQRNIDAEEQEQRTRD